MLTPWSTVSRDAAAVPKGRPVRVPILMSLGLRDIVDKRANAHGISRGQYMREAALAIAYYEAREQPELARCLAQARRDLRDEKKQ